MKNWLFLAAAIISEVIGTLSLRHSDGMSKLWPSLSVVVFYAISFYFLALVLRVFNVGVAYAIWSGVGVALIALAGWVIFSQKLDLMAIIGITLIISGVIIISVFSETTRIH